MTKPNEDSLWKGINLTITSLNTWRVSLFEIREDGSSHGITVRGDDNFMTPTLTLSHTEPDIWTILSLWRKDGNAAFCLLGYATIHWSWSAKVSFTTKMLPWMKSTASFDIEILALLQTKISIRLTFLWPHWPPFIPPRNSTWIFMCQFKWGNVLMWLDMQTRNAIMDASWPSDLPGLMRF